MATSPLPEPEQSPYERIGGAPGVGRLANRFYDLMEDVPRYATLRAMHAPDLAATRQSLTRFLTAWLGGPRDWFVERPSARCIMSMHRALGVTPATAAQWLHAMSRALEDVEVEPALASMMRSAFARMSSAMIVRD
ncbi:hemoglobin [Sphingomonas zeicaulis]|uniref:group II truncated hemoglobin n=1 Tax=Sphingomonas zeicaulis TaxID=1632740 RepID=UPI003D1FFA71